ncbi:B12-binding domain-containing radical SAM protein [Micromonospora maritima]|uniref:B12-binding domain-containing radical SAM protein n=1 Tax=Micromonospora maritima TaxID=986711 RepID=UPI00157CF62F|nr:radical SAM protein [Micromonospora maritima]
MRGLLVSGLGPMIKNVNYLEGSLFDPGEADVAGYFRDVSPEFALERLELSVDGGRGPLLLPRCSDVPHLTTFALLAILDGCPGDYDHLDTGDIWADRSPALADDYDVVLLSTTFIYERRSLRRALRYLAERWPDATMVLGGQFTNLKFVPVMRDHPEVDYVVRGDGEEALPLLMRALAGRGDLSAVPNLVHRTDTGRLGQTPLRDIDIETHPSPQFRGKHDIVPYESMRGCPFSCGFCSFPHASPRWRYKSATKIRDDWGRYAEAHGASMIKAMDSTFTVPPRRMRELFDLLPALGVGWEGYSRANAVTSAEDVERFAASHCRSLSIGFESMSEESLRRMNKRVTAKQNRQAFELLKDSEVGHRCSFMVGYPGETPEDYRQTHDFLTNEYRGYFMLSIFSMQDETMPVWQEADKYDLQVADPEDPDSGWSHCGMDFAQAKALHRETLHEVRRRNDEALLVLWQSRYEVPIAPKLPRRQRLRIEKLIERIGMLPVDEPDRARGRQLAAGYLHQLADLGVTLRARAGAPV